jgi:FMN phosphatase YigB (HAD superfamily)
MDEKNRVINLKLILEKVNFDKIEYVFFDIFDTILLRNVYPEYTKMIWSKRMNVQFGGLTAEEIYKSRSELESRLCMENEQSGKDREFRYNQLVEQMYRILTTRKIISGISLESFHDICINIETDVEIGVQNVDPDWIELVRSIRSNWRQIKIFCISDFYLPKDTIKKMFEHHGILKYIDEIYVSSEVLLTKRTGRLYDFVLSSHNIDPGSAIMIGDNEHSDFKVPTERGIKAYSINRKEQFVKYAEYERSFKINKITGIESKLYKLATLRRKETPFHNIVFSLFYFIKKLHETLVYRGVKDVFFLSREGEYLKKLFDLYQIHEGFQASQKINSHYLLVSRKATYMPSLKPQQNENFNVVFRQYRKISAYDFLASLNIPVEVINLLSEELSFDLHNVEEDFPTSLTYQKLINSERFRTVYEHERTEQKRLFMQYVDQFNVDLTNGMHIVDVGWKGTIQDNLYNIYNGEVPVIGYYLGLVAAGDMQPGNDKLGILFSSIPEKTPYFGVFNENRAIYEVLLGASHGSAERYVSSGSSLIIAETSSNPREIEIYKTVVQPAQEIMEQTFIELCGLLCKKSVDIERYFEVFAKIHADIILKPNKHELQFFDRLYHFENFGLFKFTEFKTKKNVGLNERVFNAIRLVKDPGLFFRDSFWAPLTLKDAGLSPLIPLYRSYKLRKYFSNQNKDKVSADKYKELKDQIRKLEYLIKDRDEAIANMTRMIDDRDEAIKSMTAMIDERDEAIKKLTLMIDDRDAAIKSMTAMIDERDQLIKELYDKLEKIQTK